MARGKGGEGRIGRWLYRERNAPGRGWTQEQVAERLFDLAGYRVKRPWLSQVENGEDPSSDLLNALVRLFGTEPPEESKPEPESADRMALVAALNAQAKALSDLAAEMRAWREEDRGRLEDLEGIVAEMVATRSAAAAGASREQAALRGTAE